MKQMKGMVHFSRFKGMAKKKANVEQQEEISDLKEKIKS